MRKLFFQLFLTAHVFQSTDYCCVLFPPFFTQFTLFSFLICCSRLDIDAPPFASSHQKGGIGHFFVFLVTFPLRIYLRIKFTFLYDITEFSFVIPPNLQIQL